MSPADDTATPAPRWAKYALAAVAVGGLAARLWPLLREAGPLGFPIDYDEGVYFSASALLFKGVLPYRDFVFVHPPALLYFFGLTSSLSGWLADPARAFAAARIVATFVGAANVYLAGRLVMRSAGPVGGLVAAALYATYPEVVAVERGPYLEPVLNLACLSMALVWLGPRKERSRAPYLAGALCGLALAVKVLGGIWLIAAVASAPQSRLRSELPRFLAAAAAVGFVLVAPLALPSPRAFVEQTLLFHAWRPPDGRVPRLERLTLVVNSRHLVASLLALFGFAAIAVKRLRRRADEISREEHFFGMAWALTLAAFFASSAYWLQYNSHLAASECVLAGFGAAAVFRLLEPRLPRRTLSPAMALFVALAAAPSLRRTAMAARARAPELLALGQAIRAAVPATACLFTFEPGWSLVGGRLPARSSGAPLLVDPYAAMLLEAVRPGARFGEAGEAFRCPASQAPARARLEACRFAVLGWRGDWQLTGEDRAWFEAHFTPRETPGGKGLDLWERTAP